MTIERCAQASDGLRAWERMSQERATALFLFFGSDDPVSGASWCPDCVLADPVLRAAVRELRPACLLFECPVGLRSAWKGQDDHPYRRHPGTRLERIPTLVLVEDGLERGRLIEADCADARLVRAFLTTERA